MVSESEEVTENSKLLYGWMAKQLRIVRAYVMEEDLLGPAAKACMVKGATSCPSHNLNVCFIFSLT